MKLIDRHIEIVSSSHTELSSMSLASRTAIQSVLRKFYSNVRITLIDNQSDLNKLISRKPDLVFLGMKFLITSIHGKATNANKLWMSDYLSSHGIACTGSNSFAHKLEYEKPLAKQRVLDAGLATSAYRVVSADSYNLLGIEDLKYPLFVKPTDRGGGAGIDAFSVVSNFEQLQHKIHSISTDIGSDSLIEEYLPGREFSVAIIKNEISSEYELMPIELIAPEDNKGTRILSRAVKSADAEQFSEIKDDELKQNVNELAINVFNAIGARDYGRIDIRLDEHGTPQFLEANLIPSLISNYGSFPKAYSLHQKLGYEAMLLQLVQLGMSRSTGAYYDGISTSTNVAFMPRLKLIHEV